MALGGFYRGAAAAAAAIAGLWLIYVRLAPDRYDITASLDLLDKPTFVTLIKIDRASDEACFNALDRAGVFYTRLPDQPLGDRCYFKGVATLDHSLAAWGGRVLLTCPMLARLMLWERHVLIPAADSHFGAAVTRIDHFGTYACRNVNNQAAGPRSEHAVANAIDISAVEIASVGPVRVLGDFGDDGAKGAFLEELFNGGCFLFRTSLGPDYNALHKNHFHFDNGAFETCQ